MGDAYTENQAMIEEHERRQAERQPPILWAPALWRGKWTALRMLPDFRVESDSEAYMYCSECQKRCDELNGKQPTQPQPGQPAPSDKLRKAATLADCLAETLEEWHNAHQSDAEPFAGAAHHVEWAFASAWGCADSIREAIKHLSEGEKK